MVAQRDLLRRVSRTFALSLEILPRPVDRWLGLGYLLLRVSDTFEDSPVWPPTQRCQLLRHWYRALGGRDLTPALTAAAAALPATSPEGALLRQLPALLADLRAVPPAARRILGTAVRRTTRDMAYWVRRGPRFPTERWLDRYMHAVAGRVGYLVTDLFALAAPAVARRRLALRPLAWHFGLGLQTVNVLRGLAADRARGWIYVPRSFTRAERLEPAELFEPSQRAAALRVVDRLIAKAQGHLRYGLAYVEALPRRCSRLRLACAWPLLFAAATLARCRGNPTVLEGEAKLTRAEVRTILRRSLPVTWSNAALRRLYGALLHAGQRPTSSR